MIVDDVISAGTSVGESVEIIRAAGATPGAVLIALDRMERSGKDDALSENSAVQEVARLYNMPVIPIANLDDLMGLSVSSWRQCRIGAVPRCSRRLPHEIRRFVTYDKVN